MKKVYWVLILGVALVLVLMPRKKNDAAVSAENEGTAVPAVSQKQASRGRGSESGAGNAPVRGKESVVLELSDVVKTILSDESSYSVRAQTIKELRRNLSADDVVALREFLNRLPEDTENISPIAFNSLKNDVLEVLVEQDVMPDGLGRQVVEMFNDPDADYMWKEYCLQFMEPLLKKTSDGGSQTTDDSSQKDAEQTVVHNTLFAALDERDGDLAGTALLGLNRLVRDGQDVDSETVTAKALEIAGDEQASDRCRLTAMRVAASAGNEEILPVARNLAQNARTDLLKAAAVTTLGDFADPQDKEFLTQLSTTRNRQISSAARTALAKYSE